MKKIFLSILLSIFFLTSFSQLSIKQHQANYLFGFARLMKWPSYQENLVIVNVTGESLIVDYLNQLSIRNQVSGRKLLARQTNYENALDCNILFITSANTYLLPSIAEKATNTSVLIVTEQAGLTDEGADVSFDFKPIYSGDSTLSYTFNLKSIERKRILYSPEFVGYGIIK